MYTCRISENTTTPDQRKLLADITLLVAYMDNMPVAQLADALTDAIWLNLSDLKVHIQTEGNKVLVRTASKDILLTITKTTQEPAPAILVVESQDKFGDFVADYPRAFLDTTEGMVAALSYIDGLRKDEESSVTTCTISRMVLDEATHTYQAQKGHLGKTDF